jgi:hypothetical protein
MTLSSDLSHPLRSQTFETLFLSARTHNAWNPTPVADGTLKKLYDLFKNGADLGKLFPWTVRLRA